MTFLKGHFKGHTKFGWKESHVAGNTLKRLSFEASFSGETEQSDFLVAKAQVLLALCLEFFPSSSMLISFWGQPSLLQSCGTEARKQIDTIGVRSRNDTSTGRNHQAVRGAQGLSRANSGNPGISEASTVLSGYRLVCLVSSVQLLVC